MRRERKTPYWGEAKKAIDGAYDHASDMEKMRAADEVIRGSCVAAAVVALQPVSFVDIALVTPIEVRMARALARIRGARDAKVGRVIFKPLLGRLVVPHLTIAAVKFIPFFPIIPDLIASSVAYALTYAIGEVTDCYFRSCPTWGDSDMKRRFDAVYRRKFELTYREKRAHVQAMFGTRPELARQLRALRRARRSGALSDEEVSRRADAILHARAP